MSEENNQDNISKSELLRMSTNVIAAYLGNNQVPPVQISEVISTVHESLGRLNADGAENSGEPLKPAVPIRRSIQPDHIVCLEDGKKLKMLKRYLRTTYNLSPEEYRAKWSLPSDYPMVAPNYAKQRSEFAKKIGLGRTATRRGGRKKK
ncbi:MAG: transcriptional regulator [Rhodospirillaceae bacterium]|nr:transcriptional regulator [Planctomycetaceae bacterium]MBT5266232.1 transcriptional regulator [Rhodospirillaceae bacterium]